jgi:hypothetical protein
MSQGSYSFARTLSAKRARQDAREYTRSFTTGTIPLMAEPAPREKVSLKVEQLPDFGPWAIAYTAGEDGKGRVKELPLMESYFFVKVPGIYRTCKRGIAYSG